MSVEDALDAKLARLVELPLIVLRDGLTSAALVLEVSKLFCALGIGCTQPNHTLLDLVSMSVPH